MSMLVDANWPLAPPKAAVLGAATVSCWRIALDAVDRQRGNRLAELLAEAERQRAARFLRPADRRSYIAAHAGLRLLLAAALGRREQDLRFSNGATGKPMLADGALEFNLSHSAGIVLIALARRLAVGVDVERLRLVPGREAIVRRYLHPGERADLAALPPAPAQTAFFRCWTRKEAVAKALGLGLGLPLERYRVSCRPGVPAALLEAQDLEPPPELWSIHDLTPSADHVGALAVPAPSIGLLRHTLDWPD
jgi:4'-phosphopantetheinyl transferase